MPVKKVNDERVLLAFVDNMITAKEVQGLTENGRGALRRELREQLDERIDHEMIAALSDQKLLELEKLLDDEADDARIEQFFEMSGVDYEMTVNRALKKFRDEFLAKPLEEKLAKIVAVYRKEKEEQEAKEKQKAKLEAKPTMKPVVKVAETKLGEAKPVEPEKPVEDLAEIIKKAQLAQAKKEIEELTVGLAPAPVDASAAVEAALAEAGGGPQTVTQTIATPQPQMVQPMAQPVMTGGM